MAHDQHSAGGANTNGAGENSQLGAVNGEGAVVGGGSPLGAPLSARFDLYRRICQGLVTAEELLPPDMMSLSSTLQLLPAVATCGDEHPQQHAMASTAPTNGRPVPPPRQDSEEKGPSSEPIVQDSRAPPGVLHTFIKHVRPFSLCLDPSGPSNRVEKTPSVTPFRDDRAGAAATSAIGEECSPCQEGGGFPSFDRHAQNGERGDVTVAGRGSGSVGADGGLPGSAPNPPTDAVLTGATPSQENSDSQQDVRSGRGDASATHTTSSPSSRRAKMRHHGKRKLPPSTTTAASTSGNPGATTLAHPTTSNRKKLTPTADKGVGARREARGVKPGRRSGLGAGGSAGWSSLTWKAAQTLRKRMETAKARHVSAHPPLSLFNIQGWE